MPAAAVEILKMENITKVYPNGIVASKDATFSIFAGEIHGLVGENGAGKTTVMQILFGLTQCEQGRILLNGSPIQIDSPNTAIAHGIGMVHQHFMLVPSLTVAENLVLGIEPRKGLTLNLSEAIRVTRELSEKYNLKVDPQAVVRDLPVGTKQKVEILKALHRGAKILILDEPTAVLTPQETNELFDELRILKEQGNTIVFISHKLNEVKALCDRVTVMRAGKIQGVFDVTDISEQDISRLMVGRDVVLTVEKQPATPAEVVLDVRELRVVNRFSKRVVDGVSFSVRKGEILGIAGVEGNGQRELVEALSGLGRFASGTLSIAGSDIHKLRIRQIRNLGTSHIPEDRMIYGCAAELSIEMNLMACKHDHAEFNRRNLLMDMNAVRTVSSELVSEYRILCSSAQQEIRRLSGGNIQKVVVAREFSSKPRLIIADQPTRGIDVGASEFIRNRLVELRDEGCAVLLISADLNEVMELSDSLIVMYGGVITAFIEDTSAISEEELGLYMLGLKAQDSQVIKRACHD